MSALDHEPCFMPLETAMKTLADTHLLPKILEAYRNPERTSFEDAVSLLCQSTLSALRHPESSGTRHANTDPAVQLMVCTLLRQNGGEPVAGVSTASYTNALAWCEGGYRSESNRARSPLTERDYEDAAVHSQGAVNVCALAHSLERLVPRLQSDCAQAAELDIEITPAEHPITTLYLAQLHHLSKAQPEAALEAVEQAIVKRARQARETPSAENGPSL
jgi:hypothetical protein